MLEKSDLEAIKELIDASLDIKLAPIERRLLAIENRIEKQLTQLQAQRT